ncbi:hypothetical protein QFC21_004290 [Naganishia friedmannii]|uniref:Uncharacterized protein n=1 Tax=Naganishia friedmannii TaxID=89922 RepID=A0ACC2VJC5_9TREE|nr:hypothetical protein QFC21_004290 [Naganishia friedmannii]
MTRGRAPNLALPLTKALAQQRDYRARKAANIARLEGENEVLRDENRRLCQDLAAYREGRPVPDRQQDNPSTKDASETPVAEIQHSPSSAGYLQLKISYEQLEAEVQRKEHVLLSLRDKEKEAFARLEALLQQSLQVVGGGAIAQQDADGRGYDHAIHGTTMKTELPGYHPILPSNGRNSLDKQTLVPPIRAASRSIPGYYPPPTVATPCSQTLQSGATSLSNRGSLSPDSESYRARKRVRSSSSFASAVGPYNGAPSRPYSHHPAQTYDQRTASPFLNPEYLVPSAAPYIMQSVTDDRPQMSAARAHAPPSVSPFPNYEGGRSRRERLEQMDSPIYNAERFPPSFPMPIQSSAVPFDDARSRQLQPLLTPSTTGFFREIPSYPRPSSQPRLSLHDSAPPATSEGLGQRPWMTDQIQSQPEHFPDRHKVDGNRQPDGAAVDGAQNGNYNGTHQSPIASACAPPSLVSKTCSPSKTCQSTASCNPPDQSKSQSCRSSPKPQASPLNAREIPQRVNGKEEELPPLTQANCCNGLFDCSSLPPNLWMPLHQMSTSYERGNNQTKSLASSATTMLPSPADLVSGSADDDSTEEGSLTLPVPRLTTPALKEAVERADIVTDLEAGQDEDCCFGILRCDDEKPAVESS